MKRILFLFLLLNIVSFAQPSQWKYLRPTNTGLGGDYLQCIRVDDCGNKWTGGYMPFFSEGAVSRFDDSVFTCWSNFEGYLPADRIYDMAFDQNGELWVATNGVGNGIAHGGVAHYDGNTWTHYTSANSPLPDDMRGICVDAGNNIWATFYGVQTGIGGIAKFNGTSWTIYTTANSGLQSNFVDKITADAQNNIWIGTSMGLIKFDGTTFTLLNNQNSGLSNTNVTDVGYDHTTGKLYVACGIAIDVFDGSVWTHWNAQNAPISATGLWSVDARGDSLIITTVGGAYNTYIYNGIGWVSHPELDHTYDCRIDHEGNFWICGIGFLEKYDGNNWTTYTSKNTGCTSMFNNDVFVDSRNRIWLGSSDNGGINMFDCPKWQDYNPYNYNLFPQPVNYTGTGTGITEDSYGDIWMVFNGVAGAAVQVVGGNVNDTSAWHVWDNNNSGVSLQFLYRAAADQSGNVWFGYDQACSVTKYSHSTNSWTNYNLYALGQITCGAGSGIESIRVDDSNHVWICGDAGLARYDQVGWTFYSYLNTPMQQGTVFDIAFDQAGNKWIATENGLYKFDGVNWTAYNSSNTVMVGDNVKCVLVDLNAVVWVGAGDPVFPYPYGLFSFDGTNWTSYNVTANGLPEKYVDRMALDTLGNIIVMTAGKGAAVFNPAGISGYACMDKTFQPCTVSAVAETVYDAETKITTYPNPFSQSVTISFELDQPQEISMEITDVAGRIIRSETMKNRHSGTQEIKLDLSQHAPGVYACRLIFDNGNQTVKLIRQ